MPIKTSLDRFSVGPVLSDYVRSLIVFDSGRPAWAARWAHLVIPVAGLLVSYGLNWSIQEPGPLFGGIALLSGVLLAAFSQFASFRARVADRGHVSQRLSRMFREAVTLILLAATIALIDASMLAVASSVKVRPTYRTLTALIVGTSALLTLLVLATIRRMYQTYLEAFEAGRQLPKRPRVARISKSRSDGKPRDKQAA